MRRKRRRKGLGVCPGSATERWPLKSRKERAKISFFKRYFFQLCQNIGGNKFSATGVSPKWVKSRTRRKKNTPETRGWTRLRDRTLFYIFFLVMPKYWGKQIFSHGSFPEVGEKQKAQKEKEETKKNKKQVTRLPGALPQPIGLFLFCIEFGWG